MDDLVCKAWGSEHARETLQPPGDPADFLLELPRCAVQRIFTWMQFSSRDLIDESPSRMAKLLDQHDRPAVLERDHSGGARMTNDFQIDFDAVWQCDGIDVAREDLSRKDILALAHVHWGLTAGRFVYLPASVMRRPRLSVKGRLYSDSREDFPANVD